MLKSLRQLPGSCLKKASRLAEYSVKDISVLALSQTRWVAALACGFVAWADLSDAEVRTLGGLWTSIREDWFWFGFAVCATFWVGFDPAGSYWRRRKRAMGQDECANYTLLSLEKLRNLTKVRSQANDYASHFHIVSEPLLRAVQLAVCTELQLADSLEIKANLLLLKSKTEIEVVGRSRPGSPVPISYVINEAFPAAQAMRTNRTVLMNSIQEVDPAADRPYLSVAATPVQAGAKAYGAITLDSSRAGAFDGLEEEIDRILRVFAGVILLTLSVDRIHWDCPIRYGR